MLLMILAWLATVTTYAGVSPLAVFDKTTDRVTRSFYDKTFRGLDWPRLVQEARLQLAPLTAEASLQAVINTLLAKLNASHTEFLSSGDQEYWALQSIFSGNIDGAPLPQIGAWFVQIDGKWFVKNVFEGGAADHARLLSGDEVISADNKSFQPVRSFSNKGRPVTLLVRRTENDKPFSIEVVPSHESIQRVLLRATRRSFKIFWTRGKNAAYFHLWSGTNDAFKLALKNAAILAAKRSDFFILDLRDGFGGASPEYLEPFITQSKHPAIYAKPLIVLINDGVRSGKEWITFILKNSKRATLIGTKTKGYFLAGMPFDVEPGRFLLYLAVKENPDLPHLEGVGVQPDIEVPLELPYSRGADPVFEAALKNTGA